MNNFNNTIYEALVTDTLKDTFYSDTSYRGKISSVRKYAEVIIRKLIDYDPNKKMTLGNHNIQHKLDSLNNSQFIKDTVNIINKDGSDCTHTQYTDMVCKEDFDNKMDKLLDLLSILLINYFEKYKFGSNPNVMHSFSLLPPIIRYKVLNLLNKKDPTNISVIDKLVLAILKSFNVNAAIKWVEENKNILIGMKTMSEEAFNEISEKRGIEIAMLLQNSAPPNMYELCLDKIYKVGNTINSNGLLYSDFESALPYYQENGILTGNEPEIVEFNDIMNFLYLGRKENLQKLSNENNPYIVMDFIS